MSKITAEQAREEHVSLLKAWTKAVGAVKDYGFLDRHLSDEWRYIDYNGVPRGKAEYLELIDSMLSYTQEIRHCDVRIVKEDVAIVSGIYRAHTELKGGVKLDNTIAFTAIWEIQDGQWRALVHHTTRIPDAS
ncbi:nuclear transport factor 2 family protein [Sorangium sp. So ce1036]|uniref:YybH family protein n=1 Tax=Sorangium sp. So ce1036 TaxID=3133328 RepID=UPI003F0EA671